MSKSTPNAISNTMNRPRVIICLWFMLSGIYATAPLVELEQGLLRGEILLDLHENEFYSFRSIPYAAKPVGDLRFKAPRSPEEWSGIRNASDDMPICVQRDLAGNLVGQEDCLYLTVYTPKFSTNVLRPVMFYIHGGGLLEGSGRHEMYGPEFLMPEGVVVVIIHYRLGLFGFLNFDDASVGVPGNAALKDQNMALKWVQKNIEKFGGNPNSVTIFGESAGGACVHMHLLSPMSKGLFHRVIAQSGTAVNTWNNGLSNTGIVAAKTLGFESPDNLEALKFLQRASIEQIMKVQENCTVLLSIHERPLIGVVPEIKSNEPAFLTDTPRNLLQSGNFPKIPFMLGYTDAEALVIDVFYFKLLNRRLPLTSIIPFDFHVTDDVQQIELLEKIKKFYSIEENASFVDVESDAWVNYGVHEAIKSHAQQQHKDLYFYVLSASTKLNFIKHSNPITSAMQGASHLDDLGYLFKNVFTPNIQVGTPERDALERVVKLWTNFAKFGDPNDVSSFDVVWDTVTETEMNYLDIGTEALKTGTDPFKERMKFWEELYEHYAQPQLIRSKSEL